MLVGLRRPPRRPGTAVGIRTVTPPIQSHPLSSPLLPEGCFWGLQRGSRGGPLPSSENSRLPVPLPCCPASSLDVSCRPPQGGHVQLRQRLYPTWGWDRQQSGCGARIPRVSPAVSFTRSALSPGFLGAAGRSLSLLQAPWGPASCVQQASASLVWEPGSAQEAQSGVGVGGSHRFPLTTMFQGL